MTRIDDQFYKEVTGIKDAFYQVCMQIPKTLEHLIQENRVHPIGKDTVLEELAKKSPDLLKGLYLLAFKTYEGFANS